ncbi:DUF4232 domain-containing protein [Streptomyces noursei]|uniref:DUF4232 domain-containing protein n=1 Tax=Streptomyces noursei TaxID=1971 RepID=UPI00045EFBBC|nr:DUF4232 domain-containing protein [Streptomyces noursei]AIA08098.1 hypothetical protein DC74_7680 [Streptomyces noursei]MCZ0974069.1 DUF4232 domain-containing protein [Streptomyces noursei]
MTASTATRSARRRTLRVAAAALTAAAAFSLTACSGSDAAGSKAGGQSGTGVAAEASGVGSADSSGADSQAGAQGTEAQPDSAKAGSGNGTSARSGGTSARAGSGATAAKSGGKVPFCRTSDLIMDASDSSPDQKVGEITVQMTNKGGSTCSAAGFAGVDLKDADGTSAPVHRGGEVPRITDLKPGDTATFSISYKVDFSGDSLASPTDIIVTPPNETHSVDLKWPADALKLGGSYDESIQVHPVGIAN